MAYIPAIRPENTKELLNRGLILYKQAFRKIYPLALGLGVVAFLPRLLILLYGQQVTHELAPHWRIAGLALIEIVATIFFTAMLWHLRCVMLNQSQSMAQDSKNSFKKLPQIVGAALAESALLLATTLTMFAIYIYTYHVSGQAPMQVPADRLRTYLFSLPLLLQVALNAYVFILLLFYLPLIIVENKGVFAALNRSVQLVWLNVWRVISVQITPWLMYGGYLLFFKGVFDLNISLYFFPSQVTWTATLVHIVLFSLFVPWCAATLLVQLHDLELRRQFKPFDQK